jgi:hypothetical protein
MKDTTAEVGNFRSPFLVVMLDAAGHDYKTHKKYYRSDKVEKEEAERHWAIKP